MPASNEFAPRVCDPITATISQNGTKSGAIDLGGITIGGVILPSNFTGTAISFEVCDTLSGTYVPLVNGSTGTYSLTVAASQAVPVDYSKLAAWRFIKIVSNATELSADKTIKILGRPI